MYDPNRVRDPALVELLNVQILPELVPILQQFEAFLVEQGVPKPRLWFVYGSFARGTARTGGDIDVGAIPADGKTGPIDEGWLAYIRSPRPNEPTIIKVFGHRVEVVAYDVDHPAEDPTWFDVYQVLEW